MDQTEKGEQEGPDPRDGRQGLHFPHSKGCSSLGRIVESTVIQQTLIFRQTLQTAVVRMINASWAYHGLLCKRQKCCYGAKPIFFLPFHKIAMQYGWVFCCGIRSMMKILVLHCIKNIYFFDSGSCFQGASTVIQNLFGGQYVSQLKAAGAPPSDTMQPFTLLTLDIVSNTVQTLSDAITNFTRANTLEGGQTMHHKSPCSAAQSRRVTHTVRSLIDILYASENAICRDVLVALSRWSLIQMLMMLWLAMPLKLAWLR